MMSEHCVRHRTLMMVCGIVLGKAKTTKVGMVWYELNIVNLYGRYRAGRAAKSLNKDFTNTIRGGHLDYWKSRFGGRDLIDRAKLKPN